MVTRILVVKLACILLLAITYASGPSVHASTPTGVLVTDDIEIRVPDGPFEGSPHCIDDPNMCHPCHYRILNIRVKEKGQVTWRQMTATTALTRHRWVWDEDIIVGLKVRILSQYDVWDEPGTWKGNAIGAVSITLPSGQKILYENNDHIPTSCDRRRPVRRPTPRAIIDEGEKGDVVQGEVP